MPHLAPLPSVVMAAVTPVTYTEYYCVMKKDPHEGYPSAAYEDEMPVPVGSIKTMPTNIITAVCRDSNPDAYILFSKGWYKGPYVRVLLQVTMCPHSQGCASSFMRAPIAQYEDVRLLGPTFMRLPAQDFHVKNAVVRVVAQMALTYAVGGGGAERIMGPFSTTEKNTEEVEVRTLLHFTYRFFPLALD